MTDDTFPEPVSDPEAEGLPGTADDDSSAWDDVESGRIADGRDPAALPLDREDGPLAVDEYGTTPEEARAGEPLDRKLAREVPDPALAEVSAPDQPDQSAGADADGEDVDAVETATWLDEAAPNPETESEVSMYDADADDRPVGRLVEPDEGSPRDGEAEAIARDAGAAGGAPSAEEAAMHPTPEP